MLRIRFEDTHPKGVITQKFIEQYFDISKVRKIVIEEGITIIENHLFENMRTIEEVELPDSLIVIGIHAFYDCKCLRNINFGRKLKRIEFAAFANCKSLEAVDFSLCPDCDIAKSVFSFCSSLSNVILPANLNILDEFLFSACNSLTNIEIPETINIIYNNVFTCCESLESIYIPDNIIEIDATFSGCSGLTNVRLSRNLRIIEESAFKYCESLVSMYVKREDFGKILFPDSLETISEYAFHGCSKILMIRFPRYIQEIENHAFEECLSLQTVIFDNGNHGIILVPNIFKNCACLEYVLLPESIRPHDLFPVNETPRYVFSSEPNPECNTYIQEQLESKRIKDKFRNLRQKFSEYLNPKLRHPLSFGIMLSYMSDFNNTIDENMEYSRYHRIVETILS